MERESCGVLFDPCKRGTNYSHITHTFTFYRFPKLKYVIFSGDRDASKEQILLRAKQRFDIEIDPSNVDFIFLKFVFDAFAIHTCYFRLRTVVEARWYPRFTLLLQTLMGLLICKCYITIKLVEVEYCHLKLFATFALRS